MTLPQVALILLTVLALSAGQILFKLAAESINFTPMGLVEGLLNIKLIIALIVYFIATVLWLFVLKQIPLRVAYPYVALAFIIVPTLAYFLLGEKLYWNTIIGAIFIFMGVWVSSIK